MSEIEKLLREKGMTQTEMAKRLGVVQGLIGGWARGEKPVSVEMAIRIEREFKVPCERFCPLLGEVVEFAAKRGRANKRRQKEGQCAQQGALQ